MAGALFVQLMSAFGRQAVRFELRRRRDTICYTNQQSKKIIDGISLAGIGLFGG